MTDEQPAPEDIPPERPARDLADVLRMYMSRSYVSRPIAPPPGAGDVEPEPELTDIARVTNYEIENLVDRRMIALASAVVMVLNADGDATMEMSVLEACFTALDEAVSQERPELAQFIPLLHGPAQ